MHRLAAAFAASFQPRQHRACGLVVGILDRGHAARPMNQSSPGRFHPGALLGSHLFRHLVQRLRDDRGIKRPLLRFLFQQLADERVQPDGNVEHDPRRPLELALTCCRNMSMVVSAWKGSAGEQLVEEHAQRIEVGLVRQVAFAATLLGRHVRGRAHGAVGRRQLRDVQVLGDAEVGELERAVGRIMRLDGFRSRWMMPCSWACCSAAAELLAPARRPLPR